MSPEPKDADAPLFIVDNDNAGRSGLDYLSDWCDIASSIDVATGYFEIGSLLGLDGQWQKLDQLRILMGDEITYRTKKAMLEAVRDRVAAVLDGSLEAVKDPNPFLVGVDAVVKAIQDGRIRCRVYNKDKFHAKAYITHGRLEIIGSRALVGSSNFTLPGLTQNVELNIMVESGAEVSQLQRWYESYWDEAVDISDAVLKVIHRHAQTFSPFDVYSRALRELFVDHEATATDWEENQSKMFGLLDQYQKEAYSGLTEIARRHAGAFLCDGVGLGKTFVGLMLIERLIVHEKKNVVLFAPKAVKDSVWDPELKRYLPHIGGVGGGIDFSNLTVFSHTDLTRGGDFPDRFRRIAEQADAIVIDEAHHFRNRGKRGDPETPDERSRYYRLYDLIGGSNGNKPVYFLTATPINNSLNDFKHMVELFTRQDDAFFSRTLGINSLSARLNTMTKDLKAKVGDDANVGEHVGEVQEMIGGDPLFRALVVQRSRSYAKDSQVLEKGDSAAFPERDVPQVAEYSIRKTYGNLLDLVDKAFEKDLPLFSLPIYYPLAYYTGPDSTIDPFEYERQRQVVGLIRTNFLKRFESSVFAFEQSCDRLMRKLIAFVTVNIETDREEKVLDRWLAQHEKLMAWTRTQQLSLWGEDLGANDEDVDEDIIPPEMLARFEKLDRSEYDVNAILAETYLDLDQIAALLEEAQKFKSSHDDKLKALTKLLKSKDLAGQKVLVFTEYADTARYLRKHLVDAGITGVFQLDSNTKGDRAETIRRFAPYYNGSSTAEVESNGKEEIRVLVATDVLSEGLNLQDATRLINYDIHWNPVRLMQRIGRVDRRLNPAIEERIVADHPSRAAGRGHVRFWNFLPPEDLDDLLKLYKKVSHKTLVISKALGIEHGKLLRPDDDFAILQEFNHSYEGEKTVIEQLHLEYQQLLKANPRLEERLAGFPNAIFSGRERTAEGSTGVFFCFRLPALDTELGEFTLEAGATRWYLLDLVDNKIEDDPADTAKAVRSGQDTPRVCVVPPGDLMEIRDRVLKHIKKTYLRRVDAPLGSPEPRLVCWMELNEG